MIEINLLKVLESRENYERFQDILKRISLSKEVRTIVDSLKIYFETGFSSVDWNNFSEHFKVCNPTKKPESLELYEKIFNRMVSEETSKSTEEIFKLLVTREYGELISSVALRVAEGESNSLEDIPVLWDKYQKDSGRISEIESHIVDMDVENLVDNTLIGGGYEWRLSELNESIGSLRKGDFIVIGALPETGKTTFLCSEVSHMAPQLLDKYVVWFNNEESGGKVGLRIIQACLGITTEELLRNPKKYNEEYKKYIDNPKKILVYDRAHIHYREVEKILNKYDPGLVIFDQIRKIKGFNSGSEVNNLTEAFSWGREIAKEYAPVLAVHQASGEAIGQQWVDQSMLYYSKIGVQGEADAIITIADPKEHDEYIRHINIPKNKLKGKHDKWKVFIRPQIARYESPK